MALQSLSYVLKGKQPATANRAEKDQSFGEARVSLKLGIERVGEGREAADAGTLAGKRFNVLRRSTGTNRDTDWARKMSRELGRDCREDVGSCSWKLWLSQMDMKEVPCARSSEKKYCRAGTEAEKTQGYPQAWLQGLHLLRGQVCAEIQRCLKSWDALDLLGMLRCSRKSILTPSDYLAEVS